MQKTAGTFAQSLTVVHHPNEQRAHHPTIDRRHEIAMRCRTQECPGLEQYSLEGAQPQQHFVVRHAGSGVQRTNRLQEEFEALGVQGVLDFAN